jgi:Sulfotransferase domain
MVKKAKKAVKVRKAPIKRKQTVTKSVPKNKVAKAKPAKSVRTPAKVSKSKRKPVKSGKRAVASAKSASPKAAKAKPKLTNQKTSVTALRIIGAGVGRTGTHSLKLALEHLGLGPCHHMEEVIKNPPVNVPIWAAAVEGKPDWDAAYKGYNSAVDWPTAAFWRELADAYPNAKVILTVRSAESWYNSFSQTIFALLGSRDKARPPMQPLLDMAIGVINKTGFGGKSSQTDLMKAFDDHVSAVKAAIPPERLLVFEVKEGWDPLCEFLELPVPPIAFPATNKKEEFWERFK